MGKAEKLTAKWVTQSGKVRKHQTTVYSTESRESWVSRVFASARATGGRPVITKGHDQN